MHYNFLFNSLHTGWNFVNWRLTIQESAEKLRMQAKRKTGVKHATGNSFALTFLTSL
jgi:hypothetical protein